MGGSVRKFGAGFRNPSALSEFPQMPSAEILNGRLAMLGIVAAIGAYAVTGQIIPGLF